MVKRIIKVNVEYDMSDFPDNIICDKDKIKTIVEKDMVEYFAWDEGYSGLTVEVIDEWIKQSHIWNIILIIRRINVKE